MSTKTRMSTINCPKCGQTLPGWAQQCQFCGATITPGFVRPVDIQTYGSNNRISFKEAAYIVMSILIILIGAFLLLLAFNLIPNLFYSVGGGTFLGLIGAAHCGLGVGMLLYQLWAQFIMKWCCILAIIAQLRAILFSMMFMSDPRVGFLPLLINLVLLGIYGFTLYLLYSEADV